MRYGGTRSIIRLVIFLGRGRFYSHEIKDEKDFWNVYNYIDQNPVATELVQKPEDW
ncbi:MAG: hypothetical protein LBO67_02990 [Spirochaetaceae bacterium]|jgi:REP element-mobilizing transposase RayT|nr:hypothetical protein [Spirochaetaceae bacterium]